MVKELKVVEVQDAIRDLIDWVEVYAEEFEIADEAKDLLEDKLRELSLMVDNALE
ncbi:hypothetical protein HN587_03175 [Candidatus Woesearchaeota archaeon]|jgi:hypothetical protein|nr:hypothetical protein [Candidatus Woesearchaeota archaeon]